MWTNVCYNNLYNLLPTVCIRHVRGTADVPSIHHPQPIFLYQEPKDFVEKKTVIALRAALFGMLPDHAHM